ncbi:MAG: PAS domain S-box protein, partial [Methanoregula sp.]|nr:PAS domain S-box protein [Methanoregula sp.]
MADTLRVLYVDDEPGLLGVGKLFLEKFGDFEVTTILNAPDAIRLLEQERFDAIISDYQMPEMDGITFLKQLKASGNTTPFIIFTGKGREEVVIEALNSGADFYIQKGGEPKAQFAELSNKIRYAITRRRTEDAFSESQKRTAEIIEFLPDATFAIDAHGDVIAWNRAMEVMTGVKTGEILNKGNYEYALAFYRERRPILIDLVLNPDEITTRKYPFIRREGDKLISEIYIPHFNNGNGAHVWFAASPLYDSQGTIVGAIESIRDITELRRMEDALHDEQEKYSKAFLSVPDGIVISEINTGIILEINDAAVNVFGYTREELIGKSAVDLGIWCHPEDRADLITRLNEQGRVKNFTFRQCRKSREEFPAEISAETISLGQRKVLLTVVRDITERIHAQEALKASERKNRAILHALPDMLFIISKEGKYQDFYTSDTRLLFFPPEDLIGKSIYDLFPGKSGNSLIETFNRCITTCQMQTVEYTLIIHNEPRHFEARIVPLDDSTVICLVRDLTRQKEAEQNLREGEEKFKTLFENAGNAIFIMDHNVFLDCNKKTEEIFGGTRDQIIGHSPAVLSPERQPDGQLSTEKGKEKIDAAYLGENQSFYWVHTHCDGTPFHAEVSLNRITLQGAYYIQAIVRDITERLYAEETLKESEARYRTVVEDQTEFICRFLPDKTHIFVNDAYCRYFGLEREKIIGTRFRPTIHMEDRERVARLFSSLTSEYPVETIEQRIIMPDGRVQWQRWSTRGIFNADGNLKEYQSVGHDITVQKDYEQELMESEHQSRMLLSQMPDMVMVHQDGIIVYANREAEDKTGFTQQELIGSHVLNYIVADDQQTVSQNMARRAAGEWVDDYEIDMVDKSGALHHTIVRTAPIVFNRLPSVVIILIDITERKRGEVALKESENLYRTIFETTGAATIIIDKDTTITLANAWFAKLSGFSIDELEKKKSWTEFVVPEDLERMKQYHEDRRDKPSVTPRVYEFRFINRWGEIRHCINNVEVIPGTNQSVASVVDITERKHAEDALRESGKKYQSLSTTMRLICDNVPDMVWAKDLDKRFIFVNTAICHELLNAADTDEPIGKNDMFFADRERTRHADDPDWHTFGEICRDTDQITMDAGTPQQFDENGNVQGNYLFLDVHKAPLIDKQGQMIGTVGSARDVTVSKQLETALRESEEKFRMLLLHVPAIAVQGYSMDGTTTYWYDGAENLYGYSAEEAIGKNLVELIIPPEMRDDVRKAITYMAETGQPIPASELSLMKKDGSRVAVFSSHVIIKRSQGEMELYCLDIDLTERKRTEEALHQANKKLNLLSSITRHDINNQLTV